MDHQLIFGLFRNKTCIFGFIKFPLLFSNFPTKRIRWKGRRSVYIYQVVVPLNLVLRAHGTLVSLSRQCFQFCSKEGKVEPSLPRSQ